MPGIGLGLESELTELALADRVSPGSADRLCMQLEGLGSWELDVNKRLKSPSKPFQKKKSQNHRIS